MSYSESHPNIILVLTDDQGYGDLSCLGNPILNTPNLGHLYADSIRLTDFHVAPMCTPTRGELMTGYDALNNGATFVCMGRSLLKADLLRKTAPQVCELLFIEEVTCQYATRVGDFEIPCGKVKGGF